VSAAIRGGICQAIVGEVFMMTTLTVAQSCHILGLAPHSANLRSSGLTVQDVARAYRTKALATHPDKAHGSLEAFQGVAAAREVLLRAIPAAAAAAVSSAVRRQQPVPHRGGSGAYHRDPLAASTSSSSSSAASFSGPQSPVGTATSAGKVPPPFKVSPVVAFAATLANGSLYVFDASPDAFGTSPLRSRDRVRRYAVSDGDEGVLGVIVGVASTGTVYWWRRGSTAATAFGLLDGPKAVRYTRIPPTTGPTVVTNIATTTCDSTSHVHATESSASAAKSAAAPSASATASATNANRPSSDTPSPAAEENKTTCRDLFVAVELLEKERRALLTAKVEAYYDQAAWLLRLPRYAPLDLQYNTRYISDAPVVLTSAGTRHLASVAR
jgi:hypothetical protein